MFITDNISVDVQATEPMSAVQCVGDTESSVTPTSVGT